jgi:hypothetical protein
VITVPGSVSMRLAGARLPLTDTTQPLDEAPAFNYSFSVLARGQAKPGHVVLVNGKRHGGATNLPLVCFGPTTPKQVGAKHQTCPHVAVHGRPDSTWEMGAAEIGATIRSPVIGDFASNRAGRTVHFHPGAVVAPVQLSLTRALPCSISNLSARLSSSTCERLRWEDSHSDHILMRFRGRVSVKLLKTGRTRIDYLDHPRWPARHEYHFCPPNEWLRLPSRSDTAARMMTAPPRWIIA